MGIFGDKIKKNDLSVSIVLTFFLGLGTYLLYLFQTGSAGSVMTILTGDILLISTDQLYQLIFLCIAILIMLSLVARPLFINSLDPVFSRARNISDRIISILFFVILAVTVSMACQIVGVLLVFSLLIGPGVIVGYWVKGFYSSIALSVILAICIIVISIAITFYVNIPTSFCITLMITALYVFSIIKHYFWCR